MPQIIFSTDDKKLRGVIIGKRGAKVRELMETHGTRIITKPDGFIITHDKEPNMLACYAEMNRIKESIKRWNINSEYKKNTYIKKPKVFTKPSKSTIETVSTFDALDSSSDEEDEDDEEHEETKFEESGISKKDIEDDIKHSLFDFGSHEERLIIPERAAIDMGWKHGGYTDKQISLFVKKWVIAPKEIKDPMSQWVKHIVKSLEPEAVKEFDDPNIDKPIPEGTRWADLF